MPKYTPKYTPNPPPRPKYRNNTKNVRDWVIFMHFFFCISVLEGDLGCISECILAFGGALYFIMGMYDRKLSRCSARIRQFQERMSCVNFRQERAKFREEVANVLPFAIVFQVDSTPFCHFEPEKLQERLIILKLLPTRLWTLIFQSVVRDCRLSRG